MPKKLRKKALDAIIPVDKNKLKSERLFGKIYLKIVCSISSNFILKCLLYDIISEKVIVSNSQKTLVLFDKSSEKIRRLKPSLYLDNAFTYNLHMMFNCLSHCKVT